MKRMSLFVLTIFFGYLLLPSAAQLIKAETSQVVYPLWRIDFNADPQFSGYFNNLDNLRFTVSCDGERVAVYEYGGNTILLLGKEGPDAYPAGTMRVVTVDGSLRG